MASDNNFAFLKAKASTNTSNILASVTSLYIYSVEQTGTPLSKLQTYIGIQADFYGDDIPRNLVIDSGDPIITDNNNIICDNDATVDLIRNISYWSVGHLYYCCIIITNYAGAGVGVLAPYDGSSASIKPDTNGTFMYEYSPAGTTMNCGVYTNVGAYIKIDFIKELFRNYYKS